MAKGILVRRHQRNKIAQSVRLFSTTGCKTVHWERPQSGEDGDPTSGDNNKSIYGLFDYENSTRKYVRYQDTSLFHCFISSKRLITKIRFCRVGLLITVSLFFYLF
jgi:hypothetical protein